MIASTICLFVVTQSGLSKPLDYVANALPMRVAFKEMGAQAKVALSVSRELENEPIILRLKDVPLKEAMERIASTVEAEWARTDGSGYRLQRSAEIVARLQREQLAKEAAAYKSTVDHEVEAARLQEGFDAAAARELVKAYAATRHQPSREPTGAGLAASRSTTNQLPSFRLRARVLSAISPEYLASLPEGETAVLSSRPNAMQRPLNGSAALIQAYLREREPLMTALQEMPIESLGTPDARKSLQRSLEFSEPSLTDKEPLKLVVSIQKQSSLTIQLTVRLAGSNKQFSTGARLGQLSFYEHRVRLKEIQKSHVGAGGIKAPRLARELTRRFDDRSDPTSAELSNDARLKLLQPEKHDPLALAFSEIMIAVAEAENRNLVSYAHDSAASVALTFCRNERVFPEFLFQQMQYRFPFEIERPGGWLLARTPYPLKVLEQRIPRALLGEYLRKVAARGWTGLDDYAWLLQSATDAQASWLPGPFASLLVSGPTSHWPNHAAARLYGSLTDPQREQMRAGQWFTYGDLLPPQREQLRRALFNAMDVRVNSRNPATSIRWHEDEMTEAFPTGIEANAPLRIEEVVSDIVQAVSQSDSGRQLEQTYEMENFAQTIALLETSPGAVPKVIAVAPGSRRIVLISARGSGGYDASHEMREERRLSELVPLNRMMSVFPAAQKDRLQKLIAKEREHERERRRVMAEIGEGANPPRQPEQPPPL